MYMTAQRKPVVVETKRRALSPKQAAEALFTKRAAQLVTPAKNNVELAPTVAFGVTSEVVLLGPEEARYIRDNHHFDRQRKISRSNVERLSHEIRAGRLIPGMQIYLCVMPDGSMVLVNGNHTCEAIADAGIPQPITMTKMNVADLDEAGRIYAVFDTQKARSWIDSLKATGAADDIMSSAVAMRVLSAIGAIENKFDQAGRARVAQSRIDRFEKMSEYTQTVELVVAAAVGGQIDTKRFLYRSPILSVVLVTFRYQPSLAAEFWRDFLLDDGLRAGMPAKALLSYLRNNRLYGPDGRKLQSRAAALAWNAHFDGRDIDHVKPNSFTSFNIKGTPYAKGIC